MDSFALFGAHEQVLIDDACGQVSYVPRFIDADKIALWMENLLVHVPWRDGRRQMYDREVDIPRLRAHYQANEVRVPAVLCEALQCVRAYTHVPFDSMGLNLYRDHRDSVAPHNDKLEDIIKGYPIVLLSLGATRTMVIRRKQPPRRQLRLELEAGSLLSMSWETQRHYDHGIPKQPRYSAPRISVAFRVRSEEADRGSGRAVAGE